MNCSKRISLCPVSALAAALCLFLQHLQVEGGEVDTQHQIFLPKEVRLTDRSLESPSGDRFVVKQGKLPSTGVESAGILSSGETYFRNSTTGAGAVSSLFDVMPVIEGIQAGLIDAAQLDFSTDEEDQPPLPQIGSRATCPGVPKFQVTCNIDEDCAKPFINPPAICLKSGDPQAVGLCSTVCNGGASLCGPGTICTSVGGNLISLCLDICPQGSLGTCSQFCNVLQFCVQETFVGVITYSCLPYP